MRTTMMILGLGALLSATGCAYDTTEASCDILDCYGSDTGDADGNGGDGNNSGNSGNGDGSGSGSDGNGNYNSVARFVAPAEAGSMWCHFSTTDDFDAFIDADDWPPYTAHGMVHWDNVVEIPFNAVSGAEVGWGNCTVCPQELDEEPYGAADGGDAEELGCYWFGYGSDPDQQYELGASRVEIGDHWYYDSGLITRSGQTAVVFDLR